MSFPYPGCETRAANEASASSECRRSVAIVVIGTQNRAINLQSFYPPLWGRRLVKGLSVFAWIKGVGVLGSGRAVSLESPESCPRTRLNCRRLAYQRHIAATTTSAVTSSTRSMGAVQPVLECVQQREPPALSPGIKNLCRSAVAFHGGLNAPHDGSASGNAVSGAFWYWFHCPLRAVPSGHLTRPDC